MNKTIFLALSIVSLNSNAKLSDVFSETEKAIYGEDNRVEIDNYSDNELIEKSRSVAMRVTTKRLALNRDDASLTNFSKRTLLRNIPSLCEDEKYINQYSVGDCSGFLISKNQLMTAGHCMTSQDECDQNRWVFDFKEGDSSFKTKNIYACKKIIKQKFNYSKWNTADFAIIELDRDVIDRAPLAYRTKGRIKKDTPVVVIGHPLGLPMKATDGANVSKKFNENESEHPIQSYIQRKNYFLVNIDAFGGNSGSPVFNKETKLVEGILTQGADDFNYNPDRRCLESAKYPDHDYKKTYEKVMIIKEMLKN